MNRLKSLWKTLAAASAGEGEDSVESLPNFTPRAQQVLALARKEADRFHHNFVGTEHLLLGLIKLGQGVAVNVLQKLGLDLETVRLEVEKQVGTGPDQKMLGNIPYTPRVKKVLALAAREARALNHTYVGTEHLLLGLLRDRDGVASRVLQNLGIDVEKTRQEILKELDPNFSAKEIGSELSPSNATSIQPGSEMPQNAESPQPQRDSIDTSKRYDVYCTERTQEVVVYRKALFKGIKSLLLRNQHDTLAQFVELEQADGQTLFIARYSVIKFCEPGVTPNPEIAPGKQP
jgi:ATP-dependent Clp protease ATP-binding subunit ClpA